jgi:hypothetical protein
MEIDRELDDDLNLRPGGASIGKWSIFGWEGRGVVCGYLSLSQLRTIHSGTLSKYLNCTDCMLALWDPEN